MGLWIRNQDKHILDKVEGLYIAHIADNEWCISNNLTMVRYGTYKTKKRALEVLDEIQKLIEPTIISTKYNCEIKDGHNKNEFDVVMQPDESKLEIIQPTTIVYEMPEK